MTETPGTDRDQARENVLEQTPLVPEDVEGAGGAPGAGARDDGDEDADLRVKPEPGSTDLGT
jgi:hypothetical protein